MTTLILPWLWLAAATAPTAPPAAGPAPAAAAKPAAPATAPPAEPNQPAEAPADADERMDRGLELLNAKKLAQAAAVLRDLYAALPETDLRRDAAAFRLAGALTDLGLVQAGIEYYLEILAGRRSPDLLGKTLGALKPLYERGLIEEWRFLDGVVYGSQYGDLESDVADFVEYLQALGDLRLGFGSWGRARLESLAATDRLYGWRARYLLAVDRVAQRNDEGAEKLLRQILDNAAAPADVRNLASLALARLLYERKNYEEAWALYAQVRLPLVEQDVVLLEWAWDRIASEDYQRSLGMVVGLGAPIYRRLFAPERDLIRAMALRRLCQYRAAHLAVRDFHEHYGALVRKARDREGLRDDPQIEQWAAWGTRLAPWARMRTRLRTEKAMAAHVGDRRLAKHLQALYGQRLAYTEETLKRGLRGAIDSVADELLRVDEQMSLIDYEIGAGLMKPGGNRASHLTARSGELPYGSDQVFYRFDGEYWSDELGDFAVISDDRCLR
jgi:hypothetical protein